MIVKMKFVSITGPRDDIDRVMDTYLSKYEIQLEQAISELKTVDNLQPFSDINPYKDSLAKAKQFVGFMKNKNVPPKTDLSIEEVFEIIRSANADYTDYTTEKNRLKRNREDIRQKLKNIEPFKTLDFDIHRVLQYKYVKFRFGRVSLDYYNKLEQTLIADLDALFIEGARDENYVYGVYFTSRAESEKLDAIFKSLHFERIFLPDDYVGAPGEAYRELLKELDDVTQKIHDAKANLSKKFDQNGAKLLGAQDKLETLVSNFDVRKLAACVEDKQQDFYILCGWMAEDDVNAFIHDIKDDEKVFVVVEDEHENYFGTPPTKLNNPKIFKPFEMYTRMYGLPAHDEMDPTIFVALTYAFIFGIMFGDMGQGLCLFLGGLILYKTKHVALAGIISTAGIFSTFFGWMFGSFFGFENVIKAHWLRPIDAMTTLPFVGKLNTVFIVSIAFGMALILVAMVMHIINAIKAHDIGESLFGANGLAGLVFYGAVVTVIVLFMTGHKTPGTIVLVVMFVIPLILIALKEPLTKLLKKSHKKSEEGAVMFIVQAFFELFETLLSYFSNTLSFVRIGAFAVSHAAMMQVVLMLAGAEDGSPNWVVVVLGNLFVCGMEGLVVGIQVLRLEYYEMFSRFYKGTGREFKPYQKKQRKKKL